MQGTGILPGSQRRFPVQCTSNAKVYRVKVRMTRLLVRISVGMLSLLRGVAWHDKTSDHIFRTTPTSAKRTSAPTQSLLKSGSRHAWLAVALPGNQPHAGDMASTFLPAYFTPCTNAGRRPIFLEEWRI